ncbi:MAG: hypothetical protein LBN38_02315 [Verrucomicrobiota bacterium]|jgi:uncharacterized repeat protein (TIGR04138 family)|nr:hypothetical protein [Verrucomicrobiota bacterium]
MEENDFNKTIARLCTVNRRYAPEAYHLLHLGLLRTLKNITEQGDGLRHVTGAELSEGFRDVALEHFGPLAFTVLKRWGIHTTRDLGEMVYILIAARLFGKTDDDKIEDFDDVYDFDAAFRAPFRPTRSETTAKK